MASFFEKLSSKERMGLLIALSVLFLALLDRLVISPIHSRVTQISSEITFAEKQLARSLRNLNQKEAISQEYTRYLQYLKKGGSDEEEVARILAEIEEEARRSAVYLVNVKPQEPKRRDFYKEYSVEIEAEGEMESLVSFLHRLSSSSQLLRPEKLNLSIKEKKSFLVKATILITKALIS